MYQPISNEIFHVHTWRCKHASDEQDYEYVEKAIELGSNRIVFVDHCPFPGNPFGNRMDMEQLDEYVASMRQLKKEYATNIELLIGLEVEYMPRFFDYYKELRNSRDFDLLVLGQHMFECEHGGWSFEEEDKSQEYLGLGKAIVEGANTGYFDVIAHPDRIFRFCKAWNQDMMKISYDIGNAAQNHGLILEKNYSSMKHSHQYWDEFWVRVVRTPELYGYDAHSVNEMETLWKEAHGGLSQVDLDLLLGSHTEQVHLLARQALNEYKKYGTVMLMCPQCNKHPEVMLEDGRMAVSCKCGYIRDGEIYL